MTSEYSSGMIRATLAAVPRRPLLLAAKAAVFGAVALVVGEAASFISFFAGGAALRHGISAPALGQPGVLRAVLLAGTSFCLVGLLGLGLGRDHPALGGGHRRARRRRVRGPGVDRRIAQPGWRPTCRSSSSATR